MGRTARCGDFYGLFAARRDHDRHLVMQLHAQLRRRRGHGQLRAS
jgi:hypothetical protein